jgi:hypothetical protein
MNTAGDEIFCMLYCQSHSNFAFLTAGGKKVYILLLDAPFWQAGDPLSPVGEPPLHTNSRGALDLKVQKVHRLAGPDVDNTAALVSRKKIRTDNRLCYVMSGGRPT